MSLEIADGLVWVVSKLIEGNRYDNVALLPYIEEFIGTSSAENLGHLSD